MFVLSVVVLVKVSVFVGLKVVFKKDEKKVVLVVFFVEIIVCVDIKCFD